MLIITILLHLNNNKLKR